jgi:hypothetical protein
MDILTHKYMTAHFPGVGTGTPIKSVFQSDWLIRLEKMLVILDNLGWYCDVNNVFIRQRQIQIVI